MFRIIDEISRTKVLGSNILPDIDRSLLPDAFANFFAEKIAKIQSDLAITTSRASPFVDAAVTPAAHFDNLNNSRKQKSKRL